MLGDNAQRVDSIIGNVDRVVAQFSEEELAEKRFSGEFDASKGIQQVLAVLQMAGKFSCRTSGSQLILYPQP